MWRACREIVIKHGSSDLLVTAVDCLDSCEAKSHKNKKNRSKQKYNHRGGSKSLVQHSYECGNGPAEVDRISLFKKTRYNEKNGWIEGAEPVYNELVERREVYRREKEDLGSACGDTQAMNDLEITSQACDDVLKVRSGYIRGLGKGPKPSKSNASDATSRMTNVELRHELASTREELASTREELGTTREECTLFWPFFGFQGTASKSSIAMEALALIF